MAPLLVTQNCNPSRFSFCYPSGFGLKAPNEVLRRADAELYNAKREGRNRLAVSAPRGSESLGDRMDSA